MDKQGKHKLSKEVIILTTKRAVSDIEGVNNIKDIKLSENKGEFILDIHINLTFGIKIPQIAWDIQNAVKKSVYNMTKINIENINIHIDGVSLPKEGQ